MKVINNECYFTLGEVSQMLNKTRLTILRWYEYDAMNPEPKLPKWLTLEGSTTRYFSMEDVEKLKEFSRSKKYGAMKDVTSKYNGRNNLCR